MISLEQILKDFTLSGESRDIMLKNREYVPEEFAKIARIVLAGCFTVSSKDKSIIVRPTSIEFYYHEEIEGGIKDPIVYHRNSKKTFKDIFNFGILHNHASGIDITFEKGCNPNLAVRASILIREFEIDGKHDNRSTMLYEMLYQQASIFDGISVKWVDGDNEVDVMSYPRKNVALYNEKGEKIEATRFPKCPHTEDKKYVQDMRKWQFKKKLITDKETDIVYMSDLLSDECPHFYKRFINLLQTNKIPFGIIKNTNDIWVRDYMPVQIYKNHFVQYCYNPDYLQGSEEDKESITDANAICQNLSIPCYKTELVIDGGNVVKAGRYVIMTEKVYAENKHLSPAEIRKQLKEMFHCDVLMLPWDKYEKYGHADGIVKAIDDKTVLLTNYEDYDSKISAKFEEKLSQHFIVKKLYYNVAQRSNYNWAYINFLRIGKYIILPGLGIPEDNQAFEQIRNYYPDCTILQIDALEVVCKGGALNCITWNIKR